LISPRFMPMRRSIRLSREALSLGYAWLYARWHRIPYWPQPATTLPEGQSLDIFLLAGQSNMAGQAPLTSADAHPHPRVLSLGPDQGWYLAREPLHRPRFHLRGLGPGFSFGKTLADAWPNRYIGLVPCAMGGSALQHWLSDAPYRGVGLYQRLIEQARAAAAHGHLRALLWHQGESNATPRHHGPHEKLLGQLFDRLKQDLNRPDLPIFIGEIGNWLPPLSFPHAASINQQIRACCQHRSDCHLVRSADLPHLGDRVHFGSEATRRLGRRYAQAVLRVCD